VRSPIKTFLSVICNRLSGLGLKAVGRRFVIVLAALTLVAGPSFAQVTGGDAGAPGAVSGSGTGIPSGQIGGQPGALPGNSSARTLNQPQRTRETQPVDNRPNASTSEPVRATEFQQLVEATTGRLLPIYGASIFSGVPSTFAPIDFGCNLAAK